MNASEKWRTPSDGASEDALLSEDASLASEASDASDATDSSDRIDTVLGERLSDEGFRGAPAVPVLRNLEMAAPAAPGSLRRGRTSTLTIFFHSRR